MITLMTKNELTWHECLFWVSKLEREKKTLEWNTLSESPSIVCPLERNECRWKRDSESGNGNSPMRLDRSSGTRRRPNRRFHFDQSDSRCHDGAVYRPFGQPHPVRALSRPENSVLDPRPFRLRKANLPSKSVLSFKMDRVRSIPVFRHFSNDANRKKEERKVSFYLNINISQFHFVHLRKELKSLAAGWFAFFRQTSTAFKGKKIDR